jgi:hypothetical protein
MRRFTQRSLTVLLAASATLGFTPHAFASPPPPPAFDVQLTPHLNGGADVTLSDTIHSTYTYLMTVTAVGFGTCSLTSGTVQIEGYDVKGFGNPLKATTPGTCNLYDAVVEYTITWTTLSGSQGQLPIRCIWLLGSGPTCDVRGVHGEFVSGVGTPY